MEVVVARIVPPFIIIIIIIIIITPEPLATDFAETRFFAILFEFQQLQ